MTSVSWITSKLQHLECQYEHHCYMSPRSRIGHIWSQSWPDSVLSSVVISNM